MALPRHRLGVIEEIALDAVPVAVGGFEDAHLVAAAGVDHRRDAGGPVGAVRLKGAGAQGVRKALAAAHRIVDGVGLVAVGDDMGGAQGQHGVVDDEAGVLQLGRVGGHGADATPLGQRVKDAVAAVGAAPHDEIADKHLPAVGGHGDGDAPAGVLVAGKVSVQVDLFHSRFLLTRSRRCTPWPRLWAAASIRPAPSPVSAGSRGCRRAGCPRPSAAGWARRRTLR